jgi:DNA-binding protein HU-beta
MGMTLSDLVDHVSAEHGLSKTEARRVVATIFTAITAVAASDRSIAIRDFGRFSVTSTPPREGRHPRTGKAITIPARRHLRFSPSKAVRSRLNGTDAYD